MRTRFEASEGHVAILFAELPLDVIVGTETKKMARELDADDHDVTVYTKVYLDGSDDVDVTYDVIRVPNWHVSPFVSTLTFVVAATLLQYMIYPNGFVGAS